MKLEAGEQYLSIKLAGHDFVVAFKNKDKGKVEQPDFKGDGDAVWVRKKTSPQKEEKVTAGDLL
jgi:hypothetical protein